jgi:hypothetical protein
MGVPTVLFRRLRSTILNRYVLIYSKVTINISIGGMVRYSTVCSTLLKNYNLQSQTQRKIIYKYYFSSIRKSISATVSVVSG